MRDVVLVTADSVRYDFADDMPFVDSLDPILGITAGHYTRPSLGGLHSARLGGSVRSKAVSPTIAEVLQDAGYTCLGAAATAQADPAFDFDGGFDQYENFMDGGGNAVENRRSSLREYLGQFEIVRAVYHRFFPMEAVLSGLPPDDEVIDHAIERFNDAEGPRFLWVHLMDSHRPYGRGDDALPVEIDRKAEASGRDSILPDPELTDEEHDELVDTYRQALGRTDERIERLTDEIDAEDPILVVTSDHGDELGEEEYYYHQGYRRRVPDPIVQVPLAIDGIDVAADRASLLDVGPTIASAVGAEIPEVWRGTDLQEAGTERAATVAPWHDEATVALRDRESTLVAADADVSFEEGGEEAAVGRADVDESVEQRLQELGYKDAG
ncbi:sulfatase-like hydrolase/transferase [Salinarchaeum laminariae]|uniref:sulfatase-like hydrolase/transferase n=1 Tax=Salinarchaeum laminariae TaxID=869888 RepID=UPI0020C0652B|nr:sulfatase-like hydrolase/transferase [Salinarchaeum laminariae]